MHLFALFALATTPARMDVWKTYTLPDGYSVDCPANLSRKTVPDPDAKITQWLGTEGDVTYEAQILEAPAEEMAKTDPQQILAAYVSGMLDHAKLTMERDLVFNGWPGVEVDVTD